MRLHSETRVEFLINETYTFNGRITGSSDPTHLDGDDPDPFEEVTVYLFAFIPNELAEQFESATVTWGFVDPAGSKNYLSSLEEAKDVYQLTYTKEDAEARAAEAEGTPVRGLSGDGLFVELPEEYSIVQLDGCTSRAFTPDYSTTIVLYTGQDEDLPDSWTEMAPHFLAKGSQIVESLGWESGATVLTEELALPDGLNGSVTHATAGDESNRATFIFVPTQEKRYVQIEIWQTPIDGSFTADVAATVKTGIRQARESDLAKAPAGASPCEIAGLSLNIPAGLVMDQGAADAVRYFDTNNSAMGETLSFQIWAETYLGLIQPNPEDPDRTVCPNTFFYEGALATDDPNWPADYAQHLATARGGWLLGNRTVDNDSCELQEFVLQGNAHDGPVLYVLAIARKAGFAPRIVTSCIRMNAARLWCAPISDAISSIQWVSDAYSPNATFTCFDSNWQYPLPNGYTILSSSSDVCSRVNPVYTLMATSVGIAGAGGLFEFGTLAQTMADEVGSYIANQWWANCYNSVVFLSQLNDPNGSTRQIQAEFCSGSNYYGSLAFDYQIENEEFMMPLINVTIASLKLAF